MTLLTPKKCSLFTPERSRTMKKKTQGGYQRRPRRAGAGLSYLMFCGRRCGGCTGWSRRGLSVSTSRHVEICVVQKITFAKTIQSVAIRRESQSVALLIRAEESPERNRRSIDATGDQCVGFGFPAAGMPRTL